MAKNEITFFTSVLPGGKIQPNVSEQMREAMPQFEGKRVYIKIGVSRKIRSLDQNSYYWKIVIECCRQGVREQWGEEISKDTAHDLLKVHANYSEKISEITSDAIRLPLPTHDLNTIQFSEYTERCTKFLGEMFGINVPPPNSQSEISL